MNRGSCCRILRKTAHRVGRAVGLEQGDPALVGEALVDLLLAQGQRRVAAFGHQALDLVLEAQGVVPAGFGHRRRAAAAQDLEALAGKSRRMRLSTSPATSASPRAS